MYWTVATFPLGQLKLGSRQLVQKGFFLALEHTVPAAFSFGKRCFVVLVQLLPDSTIQFIQRKELPVPQSGNDPGRYHTDSAFCTALVFWLAYSGRDYGGVVMLCQFLVGTIELGAVPVIGMVHTGLKVVRHQHDGRTAKILEHIDVDVDPVLHIHTQASFCVSIHTEGQNTDKQIHWNCFTGIQ